MQKRWVYVGGGVDIIETEIEKQLISSVVVLWCSAQFQC